MGTITLKFDDKGELTLVEIDGKKLTAPTGTLAKNPPPGVIKGVTNIGHILHCELPDGTRHNCFHVPPCKWYGLTKIKVGSRRPLPR